jgi:hypothetical protein
MLERVQLAWKLVYLGIEGDIDGGPEALDAVC